MAASTVVKIMVKVQILPPKTEFSQREQFLEKGRGLKSECEHIKAKVQMCAIFGKDSDFNL